MPGCPSAAVAPCPSVPVSGWPHARVAPFPGWPSPIFPQPGGSGPGGPSSVFCAPVALCPGSSSQGDMFEQWRSRPSSPASHVVQAQIIPHLVAWAQQPCSQVAQCPIPRMHPSLCPSSPVPGGPVRVPRSPGAAVIHLRGFPHLAGLEGLMGAACFARSSHLNI